MSIERSKIKWNGWGWAAHPAKPVSAVHLRVANGAGEVRIPADYGLMRDDVEKAFPQLVGARTSVTLWAERPDTASRLNDSAVMLSDALRAADLEPADLLFRAGAPPTVARQAAPGRFMDRAT